MSKKTVVTYSTVQTNDTCMKKWENNEKSRPDLPSLETKTQTHFFLNKKHKSVD